MRNLHPHTFILCVLSALSLAPAPAAYVPGDADGSEQVNAVDVQLVINAVLGAELSVPETACNISCDAALDAIDVQLVINAALGMDIADGLQTPAIDTLSVAAAVPGETLTVYGTGFPPCADGVTGRVGGVDVPVLEANHTSLGSGYLVLPIPIVASGDHNVSVETVSGESNALPLNVSELPATGVPAGDVRVEVVAGLTEITTNISQILSLEVTKGNLSLKQLEEAEAGLALAQELFDAFNTTLGELSAEDLELLEQLYASSGLLGALADIQEETRKQAALCAKDGELDDFNMFVERDIVSALITVVDTAWWSVDVASLLVALPSGGSSTATSLLAHLGIKILDRVMDGFLISDLKTLTPNVDGPITVQAGQSFSFTCTGQFGTQSTPIAATVGTVLDLLTAGFGDVANVQELVVDEFVIPTLTRFHINVTEGLTEMTQPTPVDVVVDMEFYAVASNVATLAFEGAGVSGQAAELLLDYLGGSLEFGPIEYDEDVVTVTIDGAEVTVQGDVPNETSSVHLAGCVFAPHRNVYANALTLGLEYPQAVSSQEVTVEVTEAPYQALVVAAPNGGETWELGTTQAITWSLAEPSPAPIDIYIYRGAPGDFGGSEQVRKYTGIPADTTSVPWVLYATTFPPGTDYWVYVVAQGGASGPWEDWSDANFSLTEYEFVPGEMVSVLPGSFTMGPNTSGGLEVGCPAEFPKHTVTLSAYQIGKYEVTNAEYAAMLNWALSKGYVRNSGNGTYTGGDVYMSLKLLMELTGASQIGYSSGQFYVKTRESQSMADHPVVMVSWYGAVAYCNWLSERMGLDPCYDTTGWTWWRISPWPNGYRLPTEAEWERAAAWSGTFHWVYGCTSHDIDATRCNFNYGNPLGLTTWPFTTPGGYFDGTDGREDARSPAGCYDMSGNVWEWCHDFYGDYPSSAQTDPLGAHSGNTNVIRGGSWYYNNPPCGSGYVRTAYRTKLGPGSTSASFQGDLGFRVAR